MMITLWILGTFVSEFLKIYFLADMHQKHKENEGICTWWYWRFSFRSILYYKDQWWDTLDFNVIVPSYDAITKKQVRNCCHPLVENTHFKDTYFKKICLFTDLFQGTLILMALPSCVQYAWVRFPPQKPYTHTRGLGLDKGIS